MDDTDEGAFGAPDAAAAPDPDAAAASDPDAAAAAAAEWRPTRAELLAIAAQTDRSAPPPPTASPLEQRSFAADVAADVEIAKLRSVDPALVDDVELTTVTKFRIDTECLETPLVHVGRNQYEASAAEWTFRFAVPAAYPYAPPSVFVKHVDAGADAPWIPCGDLVNVWSPVMRLTSVAMSLAPDIPDRAREYLRQANALFDQAIDVLDPERSEALFALSRELERRVEILMPSVLTEDAERKTLESEFEALL